MNSGYRITFLPFRYAMMVITEYVCSDGHRIHCRTETIDWQARNFCWG